MAETNLSTFRRKVDITAIIAHLLGSSLEAKNSTFYPVYQAFDLTRSPNQGALPLTSFFNFEPFFA